MAAPAPAKTASTAEDTLQRKSPDPNIVSGGRLVAKAQKSEGVDTIFTLCGGHIIAWPRGDRPHRPLDRDQHLGRPARVRARYPGTKSQTMHK